MTEQVVRRGWLDVAELGSVWGIRFVVALCSWFGRGLARGFLRVIVFYYLLFQGRARQASRRYFARAHAAGVPLPLDVKGGRAPFRLVYRHFCAFAEVALDRLLIVAGRRELFEVTTNGREHLLRLREERRGALLLGAHLGSFEAMRLGAALDDLRLHIVVDFSNAQRIQAVLDQLEGTANTELIPITDEPVELALRVRACIDRGEMVAILADRVGRDARSARVDFLGAPAHFASGPFMLAAALRCPVYLTFGLYRGANRYDLYCEPFAQAIELPRGQREQALAREVQRYAQRLEAYVRLAPLNWFNFFDFWGER